MRFLFTFATFITFILPYGEKNIQIIPFHSSYRIYIIVFIIYRYLIFIFPICKLSIYKSWQKRMCLNTSQSKCNWEEREHLLRNLVRAGRILSASFSGTPGFDKILADFAFPPSPPGHYIIINYIILQSQARIILYYRVIRKGQQSGSSQRSHNIRAKRYIRHQLCPQWPPTVYKTSREASWSIRWVATSP